MENGCGLYARPRVIERGPYAGHWAHVAVQVFTVGVMVSDKRTGNPICRWCYDGMHAATEALEAWTGEGDPPGEWIKFKGIGPDNRPHDRRRIPGMFDD